jgi:hypothetical protein
MAKAGMACLVSIMPAFCPLATTAILEKTDSKELILERELVIIEG